VFSGSDLNNISHLPELIKPHNDIDYTLDFMPDLQVPHSLEQMGGRLCYQGKDQECSVIIASPAEQCKRPEPEWTAGVNGRKGHVRLEF
jgi:hypothetical protein